MGAKDMVKATGGSAVSVSRLRKSFGDKRVLDDVDLEVGAGTIFALLGPNGAGKTTTVQILSTLIRADGGRAMVDGHDVFTEPDEVRAVIGVTGQFSAVDGLLTARENLRLMGDLHHLDRRTADARSAHLLAQFGLEQDAGKPVAAFSGGMRRQLDLAMTLMAAPRIVFLDEPTTGLDPRARRTMWDILRGLVADGVTIFLTTQYLEEADQLADRIAVMDQGRVVAEGTPVELKRLIPGGRVHLRFTDVEDLRSAARSFDRSTWDEEKLTLQIPSDGAVGSLRALLDQVDQLGVAVDGVSMETPDLDDVFLAITGRPEMQEALR